MFKAPSEASILRAYDDAKDLYGSLGIDVEKAISTFEKVGISVHSWAGDDVTGFETHEGDVHSENTVTGNYPGKARNGDELRQDLAQAMKFSPCTPRLGLQSMHAEPKTKKSAAITTLKTSAITSTLRKKRRSQLTITSPISPTR